MLKAILHGKAGRIEHNKDESVSWSQLFKAREDLLTSTVFERFAYLSDALQKHLIQHWFKAHSGEVPQCFGEFKSISYWSRFTHEHDEGSNQVEPDLIIHFDNCNILVEVKPPAGGDQYFEQWQKEIESFLQSEDDSPKDLYFLAIGRIEQKQAQKWASELLREQKNNQLKGIAAIKWDAVTSNIVELLNNGQASNALNISSQEKRILNDILDGLSLYGLQTSPFTWSQLVQPEVLSKLSLQHTLLLSVSKESR
ncbi:hypothetical protein [Vibrio breoganii]|uniref:hypothetical protein n=1 Tax=Vibrio breoganii TaxID=553239 RepID=UPI000C842EFE|nr:hypothetical protein [Vibrio breoganii]PMG07203.1 hypothetical protein BCV00_08455 [Vibrio breoganii]PMK31892.1 hypothetical protein BCU03_06050 [Vibrio breoganii]